MGARRRPISAGPLVPSRPHVKSTPSPQEFPSGILEIRAPTAVSEGATSGNRLQGGWDGPKCTTVLTSTPDFFPSKTPKPLPTTPTSSSLPAVVAPDKPSRAMIMSVGLLRASMLSGLPSLCFRFYHPTSHFPQSQARMSVSSSGHHNNTHKLFLPSYPEDKFLFSIHFLFLLFHKIIKPLLFRDPPPTFSSQLIGLGSASPLPWAHVDVPFPQDRSSQAVRM